jgi:AcrR family transcriptional regulator
MIRLLIEYYSIDMAETVKAPSGRRTRKAQLTRRRVLDAAQALFVRDGYAVTTIAAIAEAADVAVQTVYAVFANKRNLLTELLAYRVTGDDQDIPLTDRDDWRAMMAERDPEHQLGMLAAIATRIGDRMGALYEVMAGAAGADREIAALFRAQQDSRHRDQARLARSLSRRGCLRPGLSERRATDIMWALANPTTHRALVGERGWTPEEYQRWLAELLACGLLPQTPLAEAGGDL